MMTRILLTTRPHPVRRPAQRGEARRGGARAGPFPSQGPLIQRQQMGNGTAHQPARGIESRILGHKAPGQPLSETTRIEMESSFGADFSAVKIHTDSHATQMSRALNAQAFTLGNDIFFDRAKYASDSAAGGRLLAHELSHVVQQHRGDVSPNTIQRAHADVKPPIDCAAEITKDRTCHDLIAEMIRIQADQTENDRHLEELEKSASPDKDVYDTRRRYQIELRMKFTDKERVREACCPGHEVPPPVLTPAPEPQPPAVPPTPSPAPKAP
jgi:hypothetical protein